MGEYNSLSCIEWVGFGVEGLEIYGRSSALFKIGFLLFSRQKQ
jgi:hypothetical protein